jgi:opacity protein-like surface antigen
MKKLVLPLLLAGITGLSAIPASAATPYVSGSVGATWFNESKVKVALDDAELGKVNFNRDINVIGAVGVKTGDFRFEGELGYQKDGFNRFKGNDVVLLQQNLPLGDISHSISGTTSVASFMMNGYYDIKFKGVQPYVTAGLGLARVKIDGLNITELETYMPKGVTVQEIAPAYQLGAGVAIPVSKKVMIDVRYRYFATTDLTTVALLNTSVSSSNALVGLRVNL